MLHDISQMYVSSICSTSKRYKENDNEMQSIIRAYNSRCTYIQRFSKYIVSRRIKIILVD